MGKRAREVATWVGSVLPDDDGRAIVARSDFGFAAPVHKGSAQRFIDQKPKELE